VIESKELNELGIVGKDREYHGIGARLVSISRTAYLRSCFEIFHEVNMKRYV